MKAPPRDDEVEVTVFGPGYGECIVVHLGSGRWIVVDSCKRGRNGVPVALRYFAQIGVTPAEQVSLVVLTHWHDDHIRGSSELLDACSRASICISSAFTEAEFIRFLSVFTTTSQSEQGTGVDELVAVFERLNDRTRSTHLGSQDKRVVNISAAEMAHGKPCEVWTLSPSDFQILQSEVRFSALIPEAKKTMRRAVPGGENNHSVAAWVVIGSVNILLGADLETTADPRAGWDSVLASVNRPNGEVSLFKIPHHGSQNGHHSELWNSVLRNNVNAVVTPWDRSAGLPTTSDITRLQSATSNLFLTSKPSSMVRARHGHDIENMMREFQIKTVRHPSGVGAVTARTDPNGCDDWVIENWVME